ncbi:hypothetical protein MGN70_010105 [Eutypa lata]|nr:hypothetical protein MGN70_010105 [Eutypa lata]
MANFSPSDINKYRTFPEFLTRRHAPGSHPVSEHGSAARAAVVADLRVVVYGSVVEGKKLWTKGALPQDSHRYHAPVSGTIIVFRLLSGEYHQVDPIVL